jgi:predicted ATPase
VRNLPTGTVTFLFTDIEGSTKLLHSLGAEGYAAALVEHRRLIREACSRHDGVEVDTQGALSAGPIQVRVGLHTGTPLLTDEGYVGGDVHRAARIAASGHGGQIVLSATTAELVELSLTALGEHRLKDIEGPVAIFQLGEGSFPPLKTISNTNLPRSASSFIGRERELSEVLARIGGGARLLTLTGPGGSGKTRLALEAAASLVPEYRAGVFWIGLAALRDPALVTETISQTLGAKDGLAEHIAEREMLLLLDNLEQVIDAAPELVSLLQACPNLTLLVTSRELLRISGELEYAVPPLAEPEAVSLFCERSQLEATGDISELCARLDSLPLAVARTKALSPAQILERLSQRLDLLRGGRDADPRQQTLRATIEWSYDLLTAEEQLLFARLSVFAGGCTLEAAEEVADADLDTLQSLVEKSLLRFSNERYWMLETIRDFASERLVELGEATGQTRLHAEWVRTFATAAENELREERQRECFARLTAEHENVRAALAFLLSQGDAATALAIVTSLNRYWRYRGHFGEGRKWLEDGLGLAGEVPEQLRARALGLQGALALDQGDVDLAEDAATELAELGRRLGETFWLGISLDLLAKVLLERGDGLEARALLEQEAQLFEDMGDSWRSAIVGFNLAQLALLAGELTTAVPLLERSLAADQDAGDTQGIAMSSLYLALAVVESDLGRARSLVAESLALCHEIGDPVGAAVCLQGLAALALQEGDAKRAARLMAWADGLFAPIGAVLVGVERDLYEKTWSEIRARLDDDSIQEIIRTNVPSGDLDEAIEFALSSLD